MLVNPDRVRAALVFVVAGVAAGAGPLAAYVGPGAGFALASSFFAVFLTALVVLFVLLIWPFRKLWTLLRHGRAPRGRIRRFIVVGLDGQDPRLTDRFLAEGKLPNFARLAETGCYHRLATTFPSVSPVAWSSFATGTHPAKHAIFDFLTRDRRSYLPLLSSTEIGGVERFLTLGRYRLPLEKPSLRLLRKSKPFWTLLGERRVWSTVLRVPITFPPDRFYGAELSAMSVPDLLGTQGTFLFFTTRAAGAGTEGFQEGGVRVPLAADGPVYRATVSGPENVFRADGSAMELPLVLEVERGGRRAVARLGGEAIELEEGRLTGWVKLAFPAAFGIKAHGLCRLLLVEAGDEVSLYMTPISLDPEKPAMPVSHPSYYSTYLAKLIGPYSTLGLAEDTWALNEGLIEDGHFLEMTYDVDRERQDMFFSALERLRRGSLVCVFDGTDRIQHMFWRYLEEGHPAARGRDDAEHRDAIEQLYRHNDALIGRVMEALGPGDVLLVVSDHGFTSFRRGINLNAWLLEHGYLALREGADGTGEWLRDVDWSKTRVYALGLTGMYLNLAGREERGTVQPGAEAAALKREIVERMSGLVDEAAGEVAINEVFETAALYRGPYLGQAPDFLVGYNHGYRISWDGATGVVAGPVFEDNVKAWSGDHGVDPRQVPGVLFSNHPIDRGEAALIDIAPTALELFGLEPPAHMDGEPLFARERQFA